MKLAKLSLAAIVVAGLATSSFAADTLEGAFKEGKVTGALKAYYFSNDDGTDREGILNTGITLNYKTGSLNGFGANFTVQTNHAPFASADAKNRFDGYEYGSGAQLSEAYISYTMKGTSILVGRMFLDTPLVGSSGSSFVKQAFEGAAFINTDLPNTTLIAGYVQKFQNRTDGAGNIGTFEKTFATGSSIDVPLEDGGYTVAAINKSIAGLTLTAAYADAIDVVKIAYAEAAYEGKASNFGYTLAGQYYYNSFDNGILNVGSDDNINVYGLKAGASVSGINAYVAYSQVSDDAVIESISGTSNNVGVVSGLGGGADLLYTAPVIYGNQYTQNATSYAVDVNYDVMPQLNVGARYVNIDNDTNKYAYTGVYGAYSFEGALKNLSLGVEFEKGSKDASEDQELRVKANYKF